MKSICYDDLCSCGLKYPRAQQIVVKLKTPWDGLHFRRAGPREKVCSSPNFSRRSVSPAIEMIGLTNTFAVADADILQG